MFKLQVLFYYLLNRYFRKFRSREALLQWQEKKVIQHLNWLRQASSFYRERFEGIKSENYRDLPFLNKKIMMENFSTLNTAGIDREQAMDLALRAESSRDFSAKLNGITIGLSSGTSGNRGLFLASDRERAIYTGTILAKILPDSIFKKHRVAFFMRANSNLYTASQSSRLEFQFFDLLKPMKEHEERLAQFQPDLLLAPPSMLLQLARTQNAGRISIHPKKIISIAETLDPLDEKQIEKTFHQKIHQVYQCTEGFLAITCQEGALHLNEDFVQIEAHWLDPEKRKFMPIITDFSRTTQPLVRYLLNDILTVKTSPCSCGSPLLAIESIEGRADDMVYFLNSQNERVSVFPDFIRRAILKSHDQIEEYGVKQSKAGHLEVYLLCDPRLREMIEKKLQLELAALADELKTNAPIVEFSLHFEVLPGKKLRRVMNTETLS